LTGRENVGISGLAALTGKVARDRYVKKLKDEDALYASQGKSMEDAGPTLLLIRSMPLQISQRPTKGLLGRKLLNAR
jgi:hypothetical protein